MLDNYANCMQYAHYFNVLSRELLSINCELRENLFEIGNTNRDHEESSSKRRQYESQSPDAPDHTSNREYELAEARREIKALKDLIENTQSDVSQIKAKSPSNDIHRPSSDIKQSNAKIKSKLPSVVSKVEAINIISYELERLRRAFKKKEENLLDVISKVRISTWI